MEKTQQEMHERMIEMMELTKNMMKGKGTTKGPSQPEVGTNQEVRREDHLYPSGFTPLLTQATYTSTMPLMSRFPYTYKPSLVPKSNMGQHSRTNMNDQMIVPDLGDSKKREKLEKDAFDSEAQQKFELIEEKLRAIESYGNGICLWAGRYE